MIYKIIDIFAPSKYIILSVKIRDESVKILEKHF